MSVHPGAETVYAVPWYAAVWSVPAAHDQTMYVSMR